MKKLSLIPLFALIVLAAPIARADDKVIAPAPIAAPTKLLCTDLTHNLSYGATDATTGGDVTALQVYLNTKGYMTATPVGVFGPQTRAAVMKFQTEHQLPAFGYVGPMTRPVIKASTSCGTPDTTPRVTSVVPSSAAFGAKVFVYGSGFTGLSQVMLNTAAVRNVEVNSDGGLLTFEVPNSAGPYCAPGQACIALAILLQPGEYNLSVRNVNGAVSNTVPFTILDDKGTSDQNPVISGVDAPARLTIGQSGTWTIHASAVAKSGDRLHYSVVWGDEAYTSQIAAPDADPRGQLSSTFTHVYTHTGTYTPVFTITDDSGHSATASASVTVDPIY